MPDCVGFAGEERTLGVASILRSMWRGLLGALAVALLLGASPAQAEKRVALVIGNNAYESVPQLQKAVNDADAVSKELGSSASRWSRHRMSGGAP